MLRSVVIIKIHGIQYVAENLKNKTQWINYQWRHVTLPGQRNIIVNNWYQ